MKRLLSVDGHEHGPIQAPAETLHERPLKIRDLIAAFRESSRQPFPNWKCSTTPAFLPDADAQKQFA